MHKMYTFTFVLYFLFSLVCSFSDQKFFAPRQQLDRSSYSYRSKIEIMLAVLFQTVDPNNTEIRPDKDASPLRVSKEELGRFTWTFLHSTAAAYPKEPTEEQKTHVVNLLHAM
jgi:hypothetical protein